MPIIAEENITDEHAEHVAAQPDEHGYASLFGHAPTPPPPDIEEKDAPKDGKTRVFTDADGTQRFVQNGKTVMTMAPKDKGTSSSSQGIPDSELDPARRAFLKMGGGKARTFEEYELCGEKVYLWRRNAVMDANFWLWVKRDRDGALDLSALNSTFHYMRALLVSSVTIDPVGTVSFFSPEMAWDWCDSDVEQISDTVSEICQKLNALNDRSEPTAEETAALEEQEKKDEPAG